MGKRDPWGTSVGESRKFVDESLVHKFLGLSNRICLGQYPQEIAHRCSTKMFTQKIDSIVLMCCTCGKTTQYLPHYYLLLSVVLLPRKAVLEAF